MANLKELRKRIGSVKNTRKITSAMSRIAAARLVKAQRAVLDARSYDERLQGMVIQLLSQLDDGSDHPLLERREERRVGVLLLTADRGLCGGFNSNANRQALSTLKELRTTEREFEVFCVGKKGRSFLSHEGFEVSRTFDAPTHENVAALSKEVAAAVMEPFAPTGENEPTLDSWILIYNRFVNVLSQSIERPQLLPFQAERPEEGDDESTPISVEPGAPELLKHLLPVAIESRIQQAMRNSMAAEIAARRMAMDSATENATELIGDLTLDYNRERQAAITNELMEIIGGAEALKG